ncbi:sulfatase-like hydrolase/transferase [Thalassotalea aquiviva]|uniref:sulfatase-like hydrolase/transferase n=1 Tax=Thalassotalea aquiviva TaxID=3242415 RepID=UPI00352BACE4
MNTQINYKLLLLPFTLLLYCFFLNLSKIEISFFHGTLHILLQCSLLTALVFFPNSKIFRFLIAIFLSIKLFTELSYNSSLSISMVMSLFSSTVSESLAFIQFNLFSVLVTITFIITVGLAPVPSEKKYLKYLAFAGIIYLILPLTYKANTFFSSEKFDNYKRTGLAKSQSHIFNLFEYVVEEEIALRLPALKSIKGFTDSLAFFSSQQKGLNSTWKNVTDMNDNNKLLVLGIGESLRADHLSIYGYKRETTPQLSKLLHAISLFDNTYAAGTNTWNSLPTALTKSHDKPDLAKSIINLAKDAGYTTFWISNHAQTSTWDHSVSAIANQADHTFFYSDIKPGSVYDIDLVEKLKTIVLNQENKTLVVLHFYGSHMQFSDRYPAEFSLFSSKNKILDEYDNSIIFTDHVQNEIINVVSNFNGKYLFFADHGLINPNGVLPLKHDVRTPPNLDSLKVPLFTFPKTDLLKNGTTKGFISLYYFECIFSSWSEITSTDLTDNDYCQKNINNDQVQFLDANLKQHKINL